ncbi:DUF1566 domain-containing protein [Bathymodiolus thermophilus thioautotrophic gill symbiont]|uniref:Lcl C-terminal domain-containing protein n=1 Tax=Bathymodiolus thermophilus thioautotrophic gill symbiont TaxID=2360 RepID=A0A1J5TVB0_9GAMM|nr:DUF1566 domain-containing protein [Bathymodiolus thermophilus thioautotrophic gill symbiont]OIR24752.1 hypothetical protein BGC33_04490 [Bathymodiolus thermophilus thioautotrophic gill symbiont]
MKKTILFLMINLMFLANNYLLAQTCKNYIRNEWLDSRYTDHGNGTVTDNQTDLMWKKCIQGLSGNNCDEGTGNMYNWKEALQLASNHSFASHNDWRLPNIKELNSLVARHCYSPSINLSFFPNTSSPLWSSSPRANHSSNAWRLHLDYGSDNYGDRNSAVFVRLVRSKQ